MAKGLPQVRLWQQWTSWPSQEVVKSLLKAALRIAGGYTRTSPELRRVKPTDKRGRTCVKVVYVVLEAQYQSALTAAVKHINKSNDKVCARAFPAQPVF